MKRLPIASLFVLAALALGCASTDVSGSSSASNVKQLYLQSDVKEVWAKAKTTLEAMATKPVDLDEGAMQAEVWIGTTLIVVKIEAYDYQETLLHLKARKLGFNDEETANRFLRDLRAALAA